jgi:hypothetical protein
MSKPVDQFFRGYVEAFNRSLGESVDVDGIRGHFAGCFVAAGSDGVRCGENDAAFVQTLQQGYAFYRSIGTKAMSIRGIAETSIDDVNLMANVDYRATYERPTGESVEIDFAVTYLLHAGGDGLKIFAFMAGDEMALYREHGLLPDAVDEGR